MRWSGSFAWSLALVVALSSAAQQPRSIDTESARELVRLRELGAEVPTEADLELAERLLGRHGPDLPGFPQFVAGLYLRAAQADRSAGRPAQAGQRLRRAADLAPERAEPWLALAHFHLAEARWTEAEASARRSLELGGPGRLPLAWALYRQDRNAEAAEALEELLSAGEDPAARALLERLRKQERDEARMAERRDGRFTLRFEGHEVADVGEAILDVLDRHRATLAATFLHEPEAPIPVILFSREAYHDATGAPAWSGGAFDASDGRVRIPIGGLDRGLPPGLDAVLIHELTHAFVADLSKGVCPRDLHEGLAQYLSGQRSDARTLAALERGGVAALYAGGLSFVEHLVERRGFGGIRSLLEAMAETRSEQAAFERVYDRGADEERQAWRDKLHERPR
ncbi:MAG: hypothetical protein NDJ94_17170 [Vicinamibacteria bacterium]|nr:hypothetical protein [Vicinamibacteria bacterium]